MPIHRLLRPRLIQRLRQLGSCRVSLVIAGAGFGKSTLLRDALDPAIGDVLYRVPPETGTLLAFLRGLTATLEGSVPGAHLSLAIAFERAMQSPSPAIDLARWFAEHVRGATFCVTIDDLQNATAVEVPQFVQCAIDASPQTMRWVVAARDPASLPVASWLAHNMCEVPIGDAELRFTRAEIAALAELQGAPSSCGDLDRIADRTQGWAAAIGLALQLEYFPDTVPASPAAMYADLAGRIIDSVAEPQRMALLKSAVLPATIEDQLFRNVLLERLRLLGPEPEREALVAAAEDFERSGDVRNALAYYERAHAPEATSRLLASHGIALMDGGFSDIVEGAIAGLDRARFDGGAPIMLLKAIRDARLVRFDSAEAWFQLANASAIEAGDVTLRLRVIHRYALDLLRRGRTDSVAVLEEAIANAPHGHALRPLLSATLATAYTLVDRLADARVLIASAMADLRPNLLPALRTRAYHQAAYVALRCGDVAEARRYAERVLEVAVPNGLYDLAARAHSVLYEIAHAFEAHPARALEHIEAVAAFGLKSGDTHIRHWALLGVYYIEAERGNAAMMQTIELALNAPELLQTVENTNAALLPGQALRATWSSDFEHAFRLLAQTADRQMTADRRALRWAEVALFGTAAGFIGEARDAARAAQTELLHGHSGKNGMQAAAYLLVALSLLADPEAWQVVADSLGDTDEAVPGGAFVHAAIALHHHWREARDHERVLAALGMLRDAEFGGVAAMFEALPASPPVGITMT